MSVFKTPIVCDRRIYDKKGKWKSPNNDLVENVFYFVKEPLSLATSYNSRGQQILKETMTIVVFGGKPMIKGDFIYLETGEKFQAGNITPNYFESNILVKDMLKPRVESLVVALE